VSGDVRYVPHLDEGRTMAAVIGIQGGDIRAKSEDGTTFVLTVPPKAVAFDTEITMTPLTGIVGLGMSGGRFAGVDLGPEGLPFYGDLLLTIIPHTGNGAVDAVSFTSQRDGADLHLYPLELDPTRLALRISHFSTYGVYYAENGSTSVQPTPELVAAIPREWKKANDHLLQPLLQEQRQGQILGLPGDPQLREKITAHLRRGYEEAIRKTLPFIASDCEAMKTMLSDTTSWVQQIENASVMLTESFEKEQSEIQQAVRSGIEACWAKALEDCEALEALQKAFLGEAKIPDALKARVEKLMSIPRQGDLLGYEWDPLDQKHLAPCNAKIKVKITYRERHEYTKKGVIEDRTYTAELTPDPYLPASLGIFMGTGYYERNLSHWSLDCRGPLVEQRSGSLEARASITEAPNGQRKLNYSLTPTEWRESLKKTLDTVLGETILTGTVTREERNQTQRVGSVDNCLGDQVSNWTVTVEFLSPSERTGPDSGRQNVS